MVSVKKRLDEEAPGLLEYAKGEGANPPKALESNIVHQQWLETRRQRDRDRENLQKLAIAVGKNADRIWDLLDAVDHEVRFIVDQWQQTKKSHLFIIKKAHD